MTISSPPLDRSATKVYAALFHSLSDPTRLAARPAKTTTHRQTPIGSP